MVLIKTFLFQPKDTTDTLVKDKKAKLASVFNDDSEVRMLFK